MGAWPLRVVLAAAIAGTVSASGVGVVCGCASLAGLAGGSGDGGDDLDASQDAANEAPTHDAASDPEPTRDGGDVAAPDGDDEASPDGGTASAYRAAVLGDGPLAYYRLDEPSGPTMHDSSGHGFDGIAGSSVQLGVPGLLTGDADTAASFLGGTAGPDGFIRIAENAGLEPSQSISVECWIEARTLSVGISFLSYGNDFTAPYEPYVVQFFAGGDLNFYAIIGGKGYDLQDGPASLATGTVYYIVAEYDGASALQMLYLNGTAVASANVSGTLSCYDGGGGLAIGSGYGGTRPVLDGVIDEVAIYGKALTSIQVATHYKRGLGL
jgi:hypothetical protein